MQSSASSCAQIPFQQFLKLHIAICLSSSCLPSPSFPSHISTLSMIHNYFISEVTFITCITCSCQAIMNSVVKCKLVWFCSMHMAAICFNCTEFPPLVVSLSSFLWRPSGNGVFLINSHSLCSWVQLSSHSVKIYSTPKRKACFLNVINVCLKKQTFHNLR